MGSFWISVVFFVVNFYSDPSFFALLDRFYLFMVSFFFFTRFQEL